MGPPGPDRTARDHTPPHNASDQGSPPAEPPRTGRLIGIDWGERRIGVARSDEAQILAQPVATLTRRTGKRVPMRSLLALLHEHSATGVVVGLPLTPEGDEGSAAHEARALASDIARRTNLPAALWDERFTTARVLAAVREMGGGTVGRKAELDALAATLLLQQYLDARRGSSQ
jgi:putative holliday junction resolvase